MNDKEINNQWLWLKTELETYRSEEPEETSANILLVPNDRTIRVLWLHLWGQSYFITIYIHELENVIYHNHKNWYPLRLKQFICVMYLFNNCLLLKKISCSFQMVRILLLSVLPGRLLRKSPADPSSWPLYSLHRDRVLQPRLSDTGLRGPQSSQRSS